MANKKRDSPKLLLSKSIHLVSAKLPN